MPNTATNLEQANLIIHTLEQELETHKQKLESTKQQLETVEQSQQEVLLEVEQVKQMKKNLQETVESYKKVQEKSEQNQQEIQQTFEEIKNSKQKWNEEKKQEIEKIKSDNKKANNYVNALMLLFGFGSGSTFAYLALKSGNFKKYTTCIALGAVCTTVVKIGTDRYFQNQLNKEKESDTTKGIQHGLSF